MTKNRAEELLAILESFTLAIHCLEQGGIEARETRRAREFQRERLISLLMTVEEKK